MPMRLSGLASGMDTESIVAELMKAQRLKSTKIEQKKTLAEWTQEKWKAMNTKLYSFYTGSLSKMKMQGSFSTKSATSSDSSKVAVTVGNSATTGVHSIKVTQLAQAQFVTGAKLDATVSASSTLSSLGIGDGEIRIKVGSATKSVTVDSTKTVKDLVSGLKKAGINASFDSTQKRFYLSSMESGESNEFSIDSDAAVNIEKLGLSNFTADGTDQTKAVAGLGDMNVISAKDAIFEYNGADMTSATNTVTANGLTFNLLGTTGADTVNISVANDTKAVYDSIKAFIKEYNDLITEMNTSYYANSARGYAPLSDDEKGAMTDDQIEQWESKIKDSLLRRDNSMGTLLSTMRESLSGSATYGGKAYSLSSFGIVTGEYTERGLLHINGDADDSTVSAKENDLMKALEENPEAVMNTINTLANNLYKSFSDSMKSTSLRSALTFYNDKEITKNISDYEDDLRVMEDKLNAMEDRYYKQFSAMEAAMSKMNSQSSNLAAMLGTNTNK